jgi:predicted nucleic acid-binding protein
MTPNSKIFFDTAPFIYWLEQHPTLCLKARKFVADAVAFNCDFTTSVVSFAEFGVYPERNGRPDLIQDFEDAIADFSFDFLEINLPIARMAYRLRAKYTFLKGMDAFQLAAALHSGCQYFLTNGRPLSVITEINIIILEDWT